MAKKSRIPHKFQRWIDARKKFRMSNAHIQMARELGMNPKRFASQTSHKDEPWKLPLPEFIESLYEKRFGRSRPEVVQSIETMAAEHVAKRTARKAALAQNQRTTPMIPKTFADPTAVAAAFAADFASWVADQGQEKITVALSGGSTPKLLFELWASEYADKIDWSRIHFFWGDERCVAPSDDDSNYGAAKSLFLDKIQIPDENVHRVIGESDPDEERSRYENEIYSDVEIDDDAIPQFDLVILGMGEDGHTASIFPHQIQFLKSAQVCEVAIHPATAQKRITLTGPVIIRAKKVAFLITGKNKADVLADVIHKTGDFASYPASHIESDNLCFYIDEAAAKGV